VDDPETLNPVRIHRFTSADPCAVRCPFLRFKKADDTSHLLFASPQRRRARVMSPAAIFAGIPVASGASGAARARSPTRRVGDSRRLAAFHRTNALGSNPDPMGFNAVVPADQTDLPAMRQILLKVATDSAKLGATIMLTKLGADIVKTKANARDLLTEVDPEVQLVIENRVRETFPTHGFLGEESVPAGAEASAEALDAILRDQPSDWLWIVDPIDGTTNFCHSIPLSAISIGVAYKGELQVAVIMDPFAGEIFSASLRGGAYVNFSRLRVGEERTAKEAVVVTGYGANDASAESMIKGMRALTNIPVRGVRMLGSAAIMLAWVAAGRVTAYYENDLNSWDTAAGCLLVREAGGKMTDLVTGEEYSLKTRAILASNGATHDEIRNALVEGGVKALQQSPPRRGDRSEE